jgi:RNase P/RNase MRP subunit POP5
MVVKQKVGRKRYIAFEIIALRTISKNWIIKVVRKAFGKASEGINPWIVKYRNNKGLLRCAHIKKQDAIKILTSINKINDIDIKIRTIGTSGTIKCATRKYLDKIEKTLYSNQCL